MLARLRRFLSEEHWDFLPHEVPAIPGSPGSVEHRTRHRIAYGVIAVLLAVEGGSIGRTSGNTNGTVDIGPMQINEIHLPAIARRWGTSVAAAREALLNNFCANVEAGAWILRTALDSAGGDFWEGVGRYHSRTEVYKDRYLRQVLTQVLRLRDRTSGTGSRGTP